MLVTLPPSGGAEAVGVGGDDVDVVVVGTGDRKVIVYDITGRQVIHRLEGHQGSLRDLAAVPDLHLVP
mgnify:CR=1 FL=1